MTKSQDTQRKSQLIQRVKKVLGASKPRLNIMFTLLKYHRDTPNGNGMFASTLSKKAGVNHTTAIDHYYRLRKLGIIIITRVGKINNNGDSRLKLVRLNVEDKVVQALMNFYTELLDGDQSR